MSLFGRIFCTLLFAGLLVFGSTIAVTSAYRTEPLPDRWERLRDTLALTGEEAAERRVSGGAAGVEHHLTSIEERMGVELWLTDANGAPLGTEAPPASLLPLVRAAAADPDEATRPFELAQARRVRAPNGGVWVLLGRVPGGLAMNLGPTTLRALLALLIAVSVGYQLARSLARPLTVLRAAARDVAAGDLSVHVGAAPPFRGRTDELGDLGRDFDAMTGRLDAVREQQRRLLADISHELRSPLARLSLALELARRKAGPGAADAIGRIEREAERMNRLIGELLELERLENEATTVPGTPMPLVALLRALADDAAFEAQSRGVRVDTRLPDTEIVVHADPELVRRAVENVLRNALRYTPDGSEVLLAVETGLGFCQITVRDQGPGVPEESIAHLFAPFWRVGTDRDRASGGVGLGLSIADRAIRRHGGRIAARNAPGGGLEMRITLPLPLPQRAAA